MTEAKLAKFFLPPSSTIRDAIKRIEEIGRGIVLIVEPGRHLIGTVTDGDVRVAALNNVSLESSVTVLLERQKTLPFKTPITATEDDSHDRRVEIMKTYRIRHLPILNAEGLVVDLAVLDELVNSSKVPTRAMIAAGGLGTRLRPLTDHIPKPMVRLGDRPILEHIIEHLKKFNIIDIYLAVRYKSDVIKDYFKNGSAWGVRIYYIQEDEPLGTGGALRGLPPFEGNTLVINGDIYTNQNIDLMECFHEKNDATLTVGVRQFEVQVPFGVVDISGVEINRLQEKPKYFYFINAAIYLLSPPAFQALPTSPVFHMTDVIDSVKQEGGRVVSFPICGFWNDIGTLHDYERVKSEIESYSGNEL